MDYRTAGVDVEGGRAFVRRIRSAVQRTQKAEVLSGIGGFGGLFAVPAGYREPVLVSGTDGVGTKLKLAQTCNIHNTIGLDLVAMSVNDILTLGAEPLFFLDYLATGVLDPEQLAEVIQGITEGCLEANCALLGGETAEMPGFYAPNVYDLAGFCVGIVEKTEIIDGSQVRVGDRLLGLPSSGAHSNGFSLIRRIVNDGIAAGEIPSWQHVPEGWARSLVETFLTPTCIYVKPVLEALASGLEIRGMAHITGGGLPENLPRSLKDGTSAQIDPGVWSIPPEFTWLQRQGDVPVLEMFSTFNMGIGFVLVIPPSQVEACQQHFPDAIAMGEVVAGSGEVLGLENWSY
ncbi:MAG: phosphoribosylformylglycinamidine cyclo-ligase [Cyanobacteria bacterium P01_D01_bin.123]